MFKIISQLYIIFAITAFVKAVRFGTMKNWVYINGNDMINDLNLINSGNPNLIV